jgi:peptidyl-prolyl cis-trans isomerase SurA
MKAMRLFCVLAAGAFLAAARSASADDFDSIAVVVNGSVITSLQVREAIAPTRRRLRESIQDDQTFYAKARELQTNELEALIQRKLILDDFNKAGYATNILESVVEDQIKKDIKENYAGERSTLIKTLFAEGKTYESYRKDQREQFIINYMAYHNTDIRKVLISPLKIQTYYNEHQDEFRAGDQVKLHRIVITQPPGGPPGAAKQVAAEILQKIDSGTPFTEMASVYSSFSRAEGGDMGWVERKELVAALSDAAFSLKAGQHSPVIELPDTRTGDTTCYLLMVEETRPARIRPLSEVAPGIEQTLKDKESKRLVDQWIKRLEAKSKIEFF